MSKRVKENYSLCYKLPENTGLILYPLQLANMERIKKNNVIYNFDEVGTGKTISAGLAIIELLFNSKENKFENVLVLTSNKSMVEEIHYKFEKFLGLKSNGEYNGKKYNIDVIKSDAVNDLIPIEDKSKYDFIIIDEAHEYLNDNKRSEEILKFSAKKVMFLTATPIKVKIDELKKYCKIAASIISSEDKSEEKEAELWKELEMRILKPDVICKSFDTTSPVTRYFKDVVRRVVISDEKFKSIEKEPVRLIPKLWDISKNHYDNELFNNKKMSFIIKEIVSIMNSSKTEMKNKFIIFTARNDDIYEIEEYLERITFNGEKLFYKYNIDKVNQKDNTFCVLNGDIDDYKKSKLLKKITSKDENTPTIVITNYQTSEVGIDFPTYNYIINYHISYSPSNIEQRFGRIDRIGSIHNELNMCFVIDSKNNKDTSTKHFYKAMYSYIDELLMFLPSKNTLITNEIVELLINREKPIIEEYNRYIYNLKNKNYLKEFYKYLKDDVSCIYNFAELKWFIEKETSINLYNIKDEEDLKAKVSKSLKIKKDRIEKTIENIKNIRDNLNSISNSILYKEDTKNSIKIITADECLESIIASNCLTSSKLRLDYFN